MGRRSIVLVYINTYPAIVYTVSDTFLTNALISIEMVMNTIINETSDTPIRNPRLYFNLGIADSMTRYAEYFPMEGTDECRS